MRLKNDKRLRDTLFTPESYQHPAKGHLGLWQAIIEKYTKEGDTILDPMSGVGATLTAALMGRNVVAVELEPHFVAPMKASWEKMRQHPMLGYGLGAVLILRGDARCLPLGRADSIVTSPPFQDQEPFADKKFMLDNGKANYSPYHEGSLVLEQNGIDEAQLNHTYGPNSQFARPQTYTRPSAIITSPPYQDERQGGGLATREYQERSLGDGTAASGIPGRNNTRIDQWGYTRPVDAVVSSPPYAEGLGHGSAELNRDIARSRNIHDGSKDYTQGKKDAQNIGNQRGQAYWESMHQVYAECFRVLKPQGIMALVLKGFTRDGQYVDLPQQTADLVESLGFTKFDEWRRELWSLSFWRILQRRRDPAAFDVRLNYETVLAFRKSTPLPMEVGP